MVNICKDSKLVKVIMLSDQFLLLVIFVLIEVKIIGG